MNRSHAQAAVEACGLYVAAMCVAVIVYASVSDGDGETSGWLLMAAFTIFPVNFLVTYGVGIPLTRFLVRAVGTQWEKALFGLILGLAAGAAVGAVLAIVVYPSRMRSEAMLLGGMLGGIVGGLNAAAWIFIMRFRTPSEFLNG